jgi:ubiquinone/menaquinone biosynthesis C-methylase UbiE
VSGQPTLNYDPIAAAYDRRYKDNDYSGVLSSLFYFVESQSSEEILEVGCGTGYWLKQLSHRGHKLTGLDAARGMLAIAKKKLPMANLIQGVADVLPLKERTFDRIFCINAFHHFSAKQKFMEEAFRVVRPGGGAMIVGLDPHRGLDRWWIYDYFPQVIEMDRTRYPSAHSIQHLMRESGFGECLTVEAQHIPVYLPARTALEKGLLAKTSTSQLALLTDEEYNLGINRVQRDIQTSEAAGNALTIYADLRLYSTTGWAR